MHRVGVEEVADLAGARGGDERALLEEHLDLLTGVAPMSKATAAVVSSVLTAQT